MKEVTGIGFISGLFVWLVVTWATAQDAACLPYSCEASDLVLFAVIGIGFLAPAWLVAALTSLLLNDVKAISRMSTAVGEWFSTYGFFIVVTILIIIFTLDLLYR
jgi:hypothetical protein